MSIPLKTKRTFSLVSIDMVRVRKYAHEVRHILEDDEEKNCIGIVLFLSALMERYGRDVNLVGDEKTNFLIQNGGRILDEIKHEFSIQDDLADETNEFLGSEFCPVIVRTLCKLAKHPEYLQQRRKMSCFG